MNLGYTSLMNRLLYWIIIMQMLFQMSYYILIVLTVTSITKYGLGGKIQTIFNVEK